MVTNIKDGGKDANGKQVLVAEKSLSVSPDISTSVNGSASSTTKSGIVQGTIIVRSRNTDLSNLNRNTNDSLLLHAVAGGIISDLGGNSFTSGAASAGFNEAIQNELAKIKDPGIHELVSAAIGTVASKLVGGNAQTGAATALSGTKYNWLWHYQ